MWRHLPPLSDVTSSEIPCNCDAQQEQLIHNRYGLPASRASAKPVVDYNDDRFCELPPTETDIGIPYLVSIAGTQSYPKAFYSIAMYVIDN